MAQILGREVGPIGYGLMGFTWRTTPVPEDQAFVAMRAALAKGATLWNGAEFYGTVKYNSMTLLRHYFEKYPEDARKVTLMMKGATKLETLEDDSSPQMVRTSIDSILAQLGNTVAVAAFSCARRDSRVPLADALGTIDEYVKAGKVGGVALSEVRAETIHEAVKITKIVAVEAELSLWSTEVLENGVAAACAQYNIPLIAYSPLGRGMATGELKSLDDLPEGDVRRYLPRFQPENFSLNLDLVKQLEVFAAKKGCRLLQLAIGWVLGVGRRPGMPTIIPIPGATKASRVEENNTIVELTDGEMAELEATVKNFRIAGARYGPETAMNT